MTSSSPSFALKSVCCGLLALSALSGCTERTGADAFAEGSAAYAVRDFRKATKAFAECVEIEAGNVDGWMMLARAHLDLAEIPQARKALDAALQLAGGDTDVVEFDGQLAYHERDYARARAAYLKLAADDKAGNAVRSRGYGGLAVIDMASLKPEA